MEDFYQMKRLHEEAAGLCLKAIIQRDEVRVALLPFSRLPSFYDLEADCVVYENGGATITAGDVRAAKETLRHL